MEPQEEYKAKKEAKYDVEYQSKDKLDLLPEWVYILKEYFAKHYYDKED